MNLESKVIKRDISPKTINFQIFTCYLNCSKQLMVHPVRTAGAKKYSVKFDFLIGIFLSGLFITIPI